MNLRNRTILITGGTSGIGEELARQLLARGNKVIITGRDAQRIDDTRARLPGLHGVVSDATDASAIAALHAEVTARFPELDVLVNNAGIMRMIDLSSPRPLADLTGEIEVNLSAPLQMIQQFLPHLRSRKDSAIVNVTSGLAFVPLTIAPVYSATKAGLHAYTRALRAQLEGSGVRIIELAPPAVDTPLALAFEADTKGNRGMPVEEPVRRAIAGIENGREEIRPGLANVLKAMSRLAPEIIFRQLTRMMNEPELTTAHLPRATRRRDTHCALESPAEVALVGKAAGDGNCSDLAAYGQHLASPRQSYRI